MSKRYWLVALRRLEKQVEALAGNVAREVDAERLETIKSEGNPLGAILAGAALKLVAVKPVKKPVKKPKKKKERGPNAVRPNSNGDNAGGAGDPGGGASPRGQRRRRN